MTGRNSLAGIAGWAVVCLSAGAAEAASFERFLEAPGILQSGGEQLLESVLVASPRQYDPPALESEPYLGDEPLAGVPQRFDSNAPVARNRQAARRQTSLTRMLRGGVDRWAFEVDGLLLWQGNVASRPLLTSGGGTTLDANQADAATSAGPRYRIGFDVDRCHAFEGIYFRVEEFDSDVSVAGGDPANLPIAGPLQPASLLTLGRIQSAEFNWRRSNGGVITWLMGFRWVEWAQAMAVVDSASMPSAGVVALAGNDLYGSQIGADMLLWNAWPRFRLSGNSKAGIYGNRSYFQAAGIPSGGPSAMAGREVSFFGEAGLVADVGITSWLTWRTGYNVYWLTGVALPATNLSADMFTAGATLNTGQSVLLHGVMTGLEARW